MFIECVYVCVCVFVLYVYYTCVRVYVFVCACGALVGVFVYVSTFVFCMPIVWILYMSVVLVFLVHTNAREQVSAHACIACATLVHALF